MRSIDQLANEVVLSNFEEKLPGKVSEDWLDIVIMQELENKSSEANTLLSRSISSIARGKLSTRSQSRR